MEQSLTKESSLDDIFYFITDEKKGVRIGDNTFLGKTWGNCFIGSELEQWLIENVKGLNPKEAHALCQQLLKLKYINHVSTNLLPFTRACFYRIDPKKLEERNRKRVTDEPENLAAIKEEAKKEDCINCFILTVEEQANKEESENKTTQNLSSVDELVNQTSQLQIDENDNLYGIRNLELKDVKGNVVKMIDVFKDKNVVVLALLRHFG
jgi:hypothetical protein